MSVGLLKPEPFGTLTAVSGSFFHPEAYYDANIDHLKEYGALPEEDKPAWLRKFKFEVKEFLLGNTEGFDGEKFSRRVQYDDGSPEMFLRRAWAEVFPDEPIPGVSVRPFDSLYTIAHIYIGSPRIEDEDFYVHPDHLKGQFERGDSERSPLLREVRPDLVRMLNGDFEGLDLIRFRAETSSFYRHYRKDDKDFARYVWRYLFPEESMPDGDAGQ